MFFLLHQLRKLWWFVCRPSLRGASALVLDSEKRVLLVRHTYMRGWSLPSGGVNRKESFENAAKRELFEECGIEALSADFVETFVGYLHGATNRVEVFLIRDYKVTKPFVPNREIAECGWFSKNELPVEMAPKVRARLEAYLDSTASL